MDKPPRLLYCHCAYAQILPAEVKEAVLERLRASGRDVEAVADLCALAARQDPALQRWAREGRLKIAACYPRAVMWLFAAGQAPLAAEKVEVLNMRTQSTEEILAALLDGAPGDEVARPPGAAGAVEKAQPDLDAAQPPAWKPWFPVIDYDRCTQCMQCLSFCLFDVFGVDEHRRIQVRQPQNCKTNCPACSRVCPDAAIIFPKYKAGPINGDVVSETDPRREEMKVDVSALLGGDLYQVLRRRSERANSRFSRERDPDKALEERQKCMARLIQDAGIPPEVLMALPPPEEIQRKAREAMAKAQAALRSKPE